MAETILQLRGLKMTHYFDREYMKSPQLSDWLTNFIEGQVKSANNTEAINGIFKRKNDLDAVEAMVQELRKRVGLDLIEETIKTASEEVIEGGLGDGKEDSDFPKDQMEKGIEVEKEHSPDLAIRKEITKDHLTENDKYYDYLEEMEKKMDKESKASFINRLSDIANAWDEIGNVKLSKKIDKLILKIAKELEGEKDIFDKYPLKNLIKTTMTSRGGFIDTPAMFEIVLKLLEELAPTLKLKDKDKDKIKKVIEEIKEETKQPSENNNGMMAIIMPLNSTEESYDIFNGSR